MQAVILAGGLGTRLRPMTESLPKALIPVKGRPFVDYQLELLKESGIDDFVFCIGHLGERIREHLGNGSAYGCTIRYSSDGPRLLGPAGALKRAAGLLRDPFFVTYGDAYLRAPYGEIMETLRSSGRLAVMSVYRNENKYGKSDVVVEGGAVVRYDKRNRVEGMDWINYGVTALRKEALAVIPEEEFCDEEAFYGALIERKELLAFEVRDRFYEIGTPGSLSEFEAFVGKEQRGLPRSGPP
ncbi:MAG TPA: sugar phosphate nucleotidyltransferase [Nitrososphaerales archaeon]|nr:sugar phosphate nucleotidyltransferase [Nitrososphaerales archaeon]